MVDLAKYREIKPHRLRRILWAGCNVTLFRLLPNRGRRMLLRLFGAKVGKSLIYPSVRIYAPWNLCIGDLACIGPRVELYSKAPIVIGDNTVLSQDAYLCTASHDVNSPTMQLTTAPIIIGNSCWIAAKAAVLPGVTLHDGVIIGLAAVVTHSFPPLTIAAGNPARPLKQREF